MERQALNHGLQPRLPTTSPRRRPRPLEPEPPSTVRRGMSFHCKYNASPTVAQWLLARCLLLSAYCLLFTEVCQHFLYGGSLGSRGIHLQEGLELNFGGPIIVALQIEIGQLQVSGRHVLWVKRAGFLQQVFRFLRLAQLEVRGAEEKIPHCRLRRALQALIQLIDGGSKLALLEEHMAEIDVGFPIVGIDFPSLHEGL